MNSNQNQIPKKPKSNLIGILMPYLIILGVAVILVFFLNGSSVKTVSYSGNTLITKLETLKKNDINRIEVLDTGIIIKVNGTFTENGEKYNFNATLSSVHRDDLNRIIDGWQLSDEIYVIKDPYAKGIGDYLPTILMIGMGAIVLFFVFSKSSAGGGGGAGKAFDVGRSPAKSIILSKVKFKDVAGCDEEKQEMEELVEYLKNPKKYIDMGARIPKGVILKGPPGTGKTLLAKAVAGEAGVPFFAISGSDFVELFVGVGASRVRDMFKKAKQSAPCLVFIDEIDAVGRQRGTGLGGGHDEREQTLNQLLVEMDGFGDNSGVIVLAATNRSDVLDPALLRPGRFDRQIMVNLPDKKGRSEILKVHSRNKIIDKNVDFNNVAQRTPGFSGAELENVLNEAAILAVRENKKQIDIETIDEAIDRVMGGPAKKNKIITPKEKKLIAYHESGHAIVGLKLENANIVQKVTIIPRGEAGGYVLMTPKDDRYLSTKGELMDSITGFLAGRVSEEIFFDDITTGAHNDIQQATRIASAMVMELGMSKLGPIQYDSARGSVFLGRDYNNPSRSLSAQVAFEIDTEIRGIIETCLKKARSIILEHKEELTLIAETLLIQETLTNEEIVYLIEHKELPKKEENVRKESLAEPLAQTITLPTEEEKKQ